jgi:hypothetical protein
MVIGAHAPDSGVALPVALEKLARLFVNDQELTCR